MFCNYNNYFKKIFLCIFSIILIIISYSNSVFAIDKTFESDLGYKVSYNDEYVEITQENNLDTYLYNKKLGMEIRVIENQTYNGGVVQKYEEFEENLENLDYLNNFLPEEYQNKDIKAELEETDNYALLKILLSNGSYYVDFYYVQFFYTDNLNGGVLEINHNYFFEGIEGPMYQEITKIRTALELINDSTTSTESTTQSSTPTPSVTSTSSTTITEDNATVTPTDTVTDTLSSTTTKTESASNISTQNNSNKNLPKTGESRNTIYIVVGFIVLLIGIVVYIKNKQK
jgi:LPXTG-motif cell wall-anchored protein